MIVAGVGFSSAATNPDIVDIICRAQSQSGARAQWIAVPASKVGHTGLLAAVDHLALKLIVIDPAQMQAVQARCPTKSLRAAQATGFSSIAEACALAALDAEASLILPRITNARAACALASGTAL